MPAPARRQGSSHAIQETPYSPERDRCGHAGIEIAEEVVTTQEH